MTKNEEDDRPVLVLGAYDPAKTASFYRALGVPCMPHRPGVTKHFLVDLGTVVAHVVPAQAPNKYKGVAFGILVPLLHIAVTRLCSDGHIADAEGLRLESTEEGRYATISDPDGRLVLLVEFHKVLPPPLKSLFE